MLLEGDVAHQVSRVLRMQAGDQVVLLDDSGREFLVRLESFKGGQVEGRVVAVEAGRGEPRVRLTLYQGLLKGEKLEWVLQKGTELGIAAFVPIICQRSVPRVDSGWEGRYRRWQRVMTEAAEQSGRSRLPLLRPPISFQEACDGVDPSHLSLIPWEGEAKVGIGSVLRERSGDHVNLFIGPEGGFEEVEVAYARARGIFPVSLGRRILRAETAALVAAAVVMYQAGEVGR